MLVCERACFSFADSVLHPREEDLTILSTNSASGYIINGLENNIAAGNGLRGIRWLRVNTF